MLKREEWFSEGETDSQEDDSSSEDASAEGDEESAASEDRTRPRRSAAPRPGELREATNEDIEAQADVDDQVVRLQQQQRAASKIRCPMCNDRSCRPSDIGDAFVQNP